MRAFSLKSLVLVASAAGIVALNTDAQINSSALSYEWASTYNNQNAIVNRIATPTGYERTACADGSYCDWLRNLPLKETGSPVRYYNGGVKSNDVHHSVIDLDVGKRDLQQCADAVMRLKAEYHYSQQEYDKIHFNFTSGHKVSFEDWRKGRKPQVRGNKVNFTPVSGRTDNSYKNFKKYMTMIFSYAGTLSLSNEMNSVDLANIKVGDVFIYGGSPGHAVLVIDVVKNDQGKKMFLLAQSYMPAQDMHILKNPFHPGNGPWYSADFSGELFTPEWKFNADELMRF